MGKSYRLNAEKFRELLRKKDYRSLSAFAESSGVHRNTLREYLSGRQSVFKSSFEEICQNLKTDPMELMVDEGMSSVYGEDFDELKSGILEISKNTSHLAFFLFGSRVSGGHRKFSDWDIGVTGGSQKLVGRAFLGLRTKIEDRFEDFPYCLDLVNLDQAPSWFLEGMDSESIFLGGNSDAFQFFLGVMDGIRTFKKAS